MKAFYLDKRKGRFVESKREDMSEIRKREDEELPGMWEHADMSGGQTDQPEHSFDVPDVIRIASLTGDGIRRFLDAMCHLREDGSVYHVELFVDNDGLKWRVNGTDWTPPIGTVVKRRW